MATLRDIERLRLHELLWELIEIDRLRPPFTIEETEYSRAIELGPLTLNLRLDRLDRLASGGRLVIDYKTSAKFSATTWQGRRPAEPQLPLYAAIEDIEAIAVVLLNENGVKRVGVGVSDLAIDGLKAVGEFSRDELQDWPGLVRRWRRDLEQLAIEFAGGDCRIDPDNREFAEKAFAMLTRVHDKQRTVEL